jgi:hypothetical protein
MPQAKPPHPLANPVGLAYVTWDDPGRPENGEDHLR